MNAKARTALIVAALLAAGLGVTRLGAPPYFAFGEPESVTSDRAHGDSMQAGAATTHQDGATSDGISSEGSTAGRFIDCGLYRASRRDADRFRIDQWQESIGNRTMSSDRSYFRLPESTLRQLADVGDAQAALALGLNLWAEAYGLGSTWPLDEYTFISPVPGPLRDSTQNDTMLSDARAQLYNAALLGKPGAISDLFFSFGYERRWLEQQGTLTAALDRSLRIEAFAHGKLYETRFQGTDGGTTQARVHADDQAAAEARAAALMQQFSRDQYALRGSIPLYEMPREVDESGERLRAYYRQCSDFE